MPTTSKPPEAPVIDMTLDGQLLAPVSTWTRLRAIWRALPPGTLPALITAALVLAGAAILFVGVLIVALPVIAAFVILAVILGLRRPSGSRPPARR
jgi:uncharacterized membrane protein